MNKKTLEQKPEKSTVTVERQEGRVLVNINNIEVDIIYDAEGVSVELKNQKDSENIQSMGEDF